MSNPPSENLPIFNSGLFGQSGNATYAWIEANYTNTNVLNSELSTKLNLSGGTMTGNITPTSNNTLSLGTSSLQWNNGYFNNLFATVETVYTTMNVQAPFEFLNDNPASLKINNDYPIKLSFNEKKVEQNTPSPKSEDGILVDNSPILKPLSEDIIFFDKLKEEKIRLSPNLTYPSVNTGVQQYYPGGTGNINGLIFDKTNTVFKLLSNVPVITSGGTVPASNAPIQIGNSILLNGATSGYTSIKSPDVSGSYTITLPPSLANSTIPANSASFLSMNQTTGALTNNNSFYMDNGGQINCNGQVHLTANLISNNIILQDGFTGDHITLQSPVNQAFTNYTITLPLGAPSVANTLITSDTSGNLSWTNANATIDGSGNLTLGKGAYIKLQDTEGTAKAIQIATPATITTAYNLTLPTQLNNGTNPSAQQNVLTTDSSGNMYNFNKLWVDTSGNIRIDTNLYCNVGAVQLFTNGNVQMSGNLTVSGSSTLTGNISIGANNYLQLQNSFTQTASTITVNSTAVTLASANNVSVGQNISGTGIATGTTVSAISGTSLTLSQNATASGTNITLTFSGSVNLECPTNGTVYTLKTPASLANTLNPTYSSYILCSDSTGNMYNPNTIYIDSLGDFVIKNTTYINTNSGGASTTIGISTGGNFTVNSPQTIIGSNNSGALTINNGTTNHNAVVVSTNGTNPILSVGSTGLATSGDITLNGKTSGYTRIQTPDTAGSYTMTLPPTLSGSSVGGSGAILAMDKTTGQIYNYGQNYIDTSANLNWIGGNIQIGAGYHLVLNGATSGYTILNANGSAITNYTMTLPASLSNSTKPANSGKASFLSLDQSNGNVYNTNNLYFNVDGSGNDQLIVKALTDNPTVFQVQNSGATLNFGVNTQTNTTTVGNLTVGTQINGYNGISPNTTALAIPITVHYGYLTAKTTNPANIYTFTVPTPAGGTLYELSAGCEFTSYTSGTLSIVLSYTDNGGTAYSSIAQFGIVQNVGGNVSTLSSANQFNIYNITLRAKESTTFTITTSGTWVGTMNCWSSLKQLAPSGS